MKVEVEVEKCQLTQNRAPNGYAIDNDAIQIRPRQRIASVAVPSTSRDCQVEVER
jgi:hypothetical protein